MIPEQIQLRGVEVHNLKHIDIDVPIGKLVVVCGVSGSGKTSLALDTLYAEGQRRYIESFSAYTRQFLERLDKPAAERIDGIPPAVAVAHRNSSRSNRSTIGTATEASDYLRLLFARVGHMECPRCKIDVLRETPRTVSQRIAAWPPGTRFLIAWSTPPNDELAPPRPVIERLREYREAGFVRAIVEGRTVHLGESRIDDSAPAETEVLAVVDRLVAGEVAEGRLRDSLETAFRHGRGHCIVIVANASDLERDPALSAMLSPFALDSKQALRAGFDHGRVCSRCGGIFAEPEPRLFSFNSPLGACPTCEGLGQVRDPDLTCPDCRGCRLRPEALHVRVGGKNIAEISAMRIADAIPFFQQLELVPHERAVAHVMLDQIRARLGYLDSVGLGYLSLDRGLRTLSGGENQRVALTSALGSSLVNMLYILDEPSIGLHPRDIDRLLLAVRGLRDRGNTVVVIEHEEAMLRAADHLIEIGPGAGHRGGNIVFAGPLAEMLASENSLTGAYLTGKRGASIPAARRPTAHGWLRLVGARGNNLANLTVDFPLGTLCVVTGVSGAGKSTLVQDTLYAAVSWRKRIDTPIPLPYDDLIGGGQVDDVILVDQTPIGRSPRSNPVTYVKAFDPIRRVFARTVEARTHNYGAAHFSFNSEKGRCGECKGDGHIRIDMQFLADVYKRCDRCRGARYRPEILEIAYRGKNIAEVLDMTVLQALSFFRGQKWVIARLKPLIDVGLDYLRLGQPANTLSGGEAQRLKLAGFLTIAKRRRTLFILDEPTTGLHFADVVQLLDCFDSLLSAGHSLIVVEHNLQVIKAADYVIDLGPGAGEDGGRVVARGTPEEVARDPQSITGHWLAATLAMAMK